MPKTERNIFAAALVSVVGPQYNADMPSRGWVPKNEPTGNPVPYHLKTPAGGENSFAAITGYIPVDIETVELRRATSRSKISTRERYSGSFGRQLSIYNRHDSVRCFGYSHSVEVCREPQPTYLSPHFN
jgi:hypothetical protein